MGLPYPKVYRFPCLIIKQMIQLSFSVKAKTQPGQKIKIVGSLPQLGQWNPHKGLPLELKATSWEAIPFEMKIGVKFQFKIIRLKNNGEVVWEELPNNSNRKFKPKSSSNIHLQWSQAEGKVTPITKASFKIRGFSNTMAKAKNQTKNTKVQQQFNPYRDARDQQSEQSSQEEFFIVRRKMSDQIVINSGDLQQIYYSNSSLEVFSGLLKKIKIYVISNEYDLSKPLHAMIEKQLNQAPHNYMAKWINTEVFLTKQIGISNKLRKQGSLFDIASQQLHFQTLYSPTSYFILLDVDTAVTISPQLSKVPTCLLLHSSQYKDVISSLDLLSTIQLICFDDPEVNRQLYEYLRNQRAESQLLQAFQNSSIKSLKPSVEGVVQYLSKLRQPTHIMKQTNNITQNEGLDIVSQENTICILDSSIVQNIPHFMNELTAKIHHHSLVIIVCQDHLSEYILALRNQKNIAIVYDNFEKIILQGEQYHPLRRFRQILQTIRMKSKLYSQNYGGEIVDKENSIIYYLPQGKEQWAIKIQNECKNTVKRFKCFKVSSKGTRVKVTWNLAKQVRLIRTICEIKYTNFGQLGNFNLIGEGKNLKQLKDDLRLIIEHKPQLFKRPNDTKINYYSLGVVYSSNKTSYNQQ